MSEQASNFPNEQLNLAKGWVREAGIFLRSHLDEAPQVATKSRYDDLVTNFDGQVQEELVSKILAHFPDDKILAEENGKSEPDFDLASSNFWVIDPIDGTTNFIVQKAEFAVMLAYYQAGKPQFGMILDVMADRLFWNDAEQSYCEDEALPVRWPELETSLLALNSYMFKSNANHLQELASKSLGVRNFGSAGISYVKILEGRILGYVSNLYPWDYAPGSILLSKIGFDSWTIEGDSPSLMGREKVFSGPVHLKDEVLSILSQSEL
ncbi:inositol monophosphatase family protein [Lactococcus termiticola]|uniref:Inositol monophosphatase n=1 Tax=Lactococcus termiticola TaxID=2169526 RepID=A0A2R5HHF9_9LACT|nr:inositol monophosphatase family protein [Lactococcus termiticola]GBG96785.1 inositol monophosphatase [Lactococcus termiticola]